MPPPTPSQASLAAELERPDRDAQLEPGERARETDRARVDLARPVLSSSAITFSAATFGAPVTDPGGMPPRTQLGVADPVAQHAATSETRCQTPACGRACASARPRSTRARTRGRGRCGRGRRSSRSRPGPWPTRQRVALGAAAAGRPGAAGALDRGAAHAPPAALEEELGREAGHRAPRPGEERGAVGAQALDGGDEQVDRLAAQPRLQARGRCWPGTGRRRGSACGTPRPRAA